MVNHDLTGDFCIWLNLTNNNGFLVVEVGAAGVSFADIAYYQKRAAWEENHADCPPPEPYRLDYADPGLMQQIKQKVQEFECHGHQSSG